MNNRASILVLLAFAAACGSSSSNIGTVGGSAFEVKDTVSNVYTANSNNVTVNFATVILAEFPSVCDDLGNAHPAGRAVVVTVTNPNAPVAPGTFSFSANDQTSGAAVISVGPTGINPATSGTVTFDSITNGAIKGSFDATFQDGHLASSFDGAQCGSLTSANLGGS